MFAMRHVSALLALLAVVALATPSPAQHRVISIGFDSLHVRDEDDDFDNDEPYLIAIRFRVRYGLNGQPLDNTLQVSRLLGRHNNLYINGNDDWAAEMATHQLHPALSRALEEVIPSDESNWMVGMIFAFMEEDELDNSFVDVITNRICTTIEQALQNGRITQSEAEDVGKSLAGEYLTRVKEDLESVDLGALVDALKPDDFGGFKIAMAATVPNPVGGVNVVTYFGDLPTEEQWQTVSLAMDHPNDFQAQLAAVRALDETGTIDLNARGVSNIGFHFPTHDWVTRIPWIARYQGSAILRGRIRVLDVPQDRSTPLSQSTQDRLPGEWSIHHANSRGRLFLYADGENGAFESSRLGTYYPVNSEGECDWRRGSRVMLEKGIVSNRVVFAFYPNNDPELRGGQQGSDFDFHIYSEGSGPDMMAGIVGTRTAYDAHGPTGYARKGDFLTLALPRQHANAPVSDWKHYPGRWAVVYNGRNPRIMRVEPYYGEGGRLLGRESNGYKQLNAWFEDAPQDRFQLYVMNESPQDIFFCTSWWPSNTAWVGGRLKCVGRVLGSQPGVVAGTDLPNLISRARWYGFHMMQLERTPSRGPQSREELIELAETNLDNYDEFATDESLRVLGAVVREMQFGRVVGVGDSIVTFTPESGGENITVRSDSNGEFQFRAPRGDYHATASNGSLRSEVHNVHVDGGGRRIVLSLPAKYQLSPTIELGTKRIRDGLLSAGPQPMPPKQIVEETLRDSRQIRDGNRSASPQPMPPRQAEDWIVQEMIPNRSGIRSAGPKPEPSKIGPVSTVRRGVILAPSLTNPGQYLTVSGARLEWFDGSGVRRASTTSSNSGQYSVNLAPGDYRLNVDAPQGLHDESREIQLTVESNMMRIVLRPEASSRIPQASEAAVGIPPRSSDILSSGDTSTSNPRNSALLKVSVFAATGAMQSKSPVAGVKVTAIGVDGKHYAATTVQNGVANLKVPAGNYRIYAGRTGFRTASAFASVSSRGGTAAVELTKKLSSVVVLAAPNSDSSPGSRTAESPVRVVTVVGGEFGNQSVPISGARVSVKYNNQINFSGSTGKDGRLNARGPYGQRGQIRVEHPGYTTATKDAKFGDAVTIFLKPRGPRQTMSNRPPATNAATTKIRVKVIDSSTNRPIRGATVMIGDAQKGGDSLYEGNAGFYGAKIGPGAYRVQVVKNGYRTKTVSVVVSSGKQADVTVALDSSLF